MKKLKLAVTRIVTIIKSKDKESIKKLAIDFLVIIIIVILIKVPIIFIRDFGVDFLIALDNYNEEMLNNYYLGWNIVYYLIVLITIIKSITKKYGN